MKSDLLALIKQIDDIKTLFHIVGGNGIPRVNAIYDTSVFSTWKQEVQFELQDIYDRTKDKFIWNALVNLKQGFNGWKDETAFNELSGSCSSIAGYGIPLDQDIYDYLKLQFETHNLHIILVLSQNYYNSVACMNEMGAAWILQNRYTTILLPGFEFKEIKGAINPRQIGLKLDNNDLTDVKEKLGQLKDCLLNEFGLHPVSDIRWE